MASKLPPIPSVFLEAGPFDAYSDSERKTAFHKQGLLFFRRLARLLDIPKEDIRISSNLGGNAVSGEVTFHFKSVYAQISESSMSRGLSMFYRDCKGLKDYSGGQNHFMRFDRNTNARDILTQFAMISPEFKALVDAHELRENLAKAPETAPKRGLSL